MTDQATPPDSSAAATVAVAADPRRLSLEQFCRELSLIDKRVELIAGFHHSEIRSGNLMDSEDAYKLRYEAFKGAEPIVKPVVQPRISRFKK